MSVPMSAGLMDEIAPETIQGRESRAPPSAKRSMELGKAILSAAMKSRVATCELDDLLAEVIG